MELELKAYQKYQENKEKEWESRCLRCGACCGAYDDPCQHLRKNKSNKFFCEIYSARFGMRKTIKGEVFQCVPIKKLFTTNWKKDRYCAYKKQLKI